MENAKHDERPISVLFVDDELWVLRSIRRALAGSPYQVHIAWGPSEAIEMLGAVPIDVAVFDIDMPDISGLELAHIARREHPQVLRMLLSGHATLERALDAINEGEVVRFFQKPFEAPAFIEQMKALEDRILRARGDGDESRRQAWLAEFAAWMEQRFPGATQIDRNDAGEVIIDLSTMAAELEGLALPAEANNLLRREL